MIKEIERQIARLPILQYAFIETGQIPFSQRVREVCKAECPRYGTSWSCPPAVGSVEECRKKCLCFDRCLVFSTVAESVDTADFAQMLETARAHEKITRKVRDLFAEKGCEVQALSSESCETCRTCTYPDAPCRHPDQMFPCVESYGILVSELAEKCGMDFSNGAGTVTWFGLILFSDKG